MHPGAPYMLKIIAISNPKGGVGKTTTAINLAASLATAEKRVLLIDLDPNGAVSLGLGIENGLLSKGLFEVMLGTVNLLDAVHHFQFPEFDVLPCNVQSNEEEKRLLAMTKNRIGLKNKIYDLVRRKKMVYDFIIMDTPPILNDLTLSAFCAATSVLIPLQCGYFSLRLVDKLFQAIRRVKISINPDLYVEGILLNFYEKNTRESRQVARAAKAQFGDLVFDSVIPKNAAIGFSAFKQKPILLLDALATGAIAYMKLAEEILRRDARLLGNIPAWASDQRASHS